MYLCNYEAVGNEESNNSESNTSANNASSSMTMGAVHSNASEIANSNMSQGSRNNPSSSVQILNEAAYQTAQALSSRAVELYMDIKSKALNTTAAENAEKGLGSLNRDIDNRVPFDTIDHLIDNTISPALNSAYDLKLKMEEG
jgi:hypothetical protein